MLICLEYMLVSETEANLSEGKISANSPIGKGLLTKEKGGLQRVAVIKILRVFMLHFWFYSPILLWYFCLPCILCQYNTLSCSFCFMHLNS